MKYISENLELFFALIMTVVVFIVTVNEKVRTLLLSAFKYRSTKTQLKRDTVESTDSMLDTMQNRINKLADDYVLLSESNSKTRQENLTTKQENYKLQSRLSDLEHTCNEMKKQMASKCINKCFEDVRDK